MTVAAGAAEPGAAVADAARRWIGTPWQHGATRRGAGCDCLGLVRGVWRDLLGAEPGTVPAYGVGWASEDGGARLIRGLSDHFRPVPMAIAGPAPGEVLLFALRPAGPGLHLGICVTATGFVHAYRRHGVVESALTGPWQRRLAARFAFPLPDR